MNSFEKLFTLTLLWDIPDEKYPISVMTSDGSYLCRQIAQYEDIYVYITKQLPDGEPRNEVLTHLKTITGDNCLVIFAGSSGKQEWWWLGNNDEYDCVRFDEGFSSPNFDSFTQKLALPNSRNPSKSEVIKNIHSVFLDMNINN